MRAALASLLIVVTLAAVAVAANFPALSGRIVDQAGIIPEATRTALEPKLADLEQKSGIQLVIATVRSLDGQAIEPYANELFRTWKLGEAQKNNGVLLLVAPNDRKVRIEVGYGLEGTLTDALSKVIIANAMAPRFKTGDFGDGIVRGVDDIITVLTTDASEWQARPSLRSDDQEGNAWVVGLFILMLIIVFWMSTRSRQRSGVWGRRGGGGPAIWIPSGGSSWSGGGGWGGGGGGGFSGGGFSGGGGSSGGGGASGGW